MTYTSLIRGFTKGKVNIVIAVALVNLVGLIFETASVYHTYPLMVKLSQFVAIIVQAVCTYFIFKGIYKYYQPIYLFCVYSIILTVLVTNLAYYLYPEFRPETISSNAMQDVLYLTMYLTVSGFILSKRHIIIQGVILNLFILFYTTVLKLEFFVVNGFVNILSSIGFTFILYFLVNVISNFNLGLKASIDEEKSAGELQKKRAAQLEKYQSKIYSLSNVDNLYNKTTSEFNELIVKVLGEGMGVDRVSLWLFNMENDTLTRSTSWPASEVLDASQILKEQDYPNYFSSIKKNLYLAVDDIKNSQISEEVLVPYLLPNKLSSILHCMFMVDGEPAGIICCGSQSTIRQWTTEDILFSQAMCDFIAVASKNFEIKKLLSEIHGKNADLEVQNKTNVELNEELNQLNEELSAVNENLEGIVADRTKRLESQNERLKEYAFINSHLLRAPIASILGLADLISREVSSAKDKKLIVKLDETAKQLDDIVKKISDILYDENDFDPSNSTESLLKNKLK